MIHDKEAAALQRCNCSDCCSARRKNWDDQREDIQVIPTTCTYDPQKIKNSPLGMYHCPLCGEMVLAGVPHPGTIE